MEIPRNIRQIGDIEHDLHLYMEDYVATFIEKMKKRNDTCIGVFLGQQAKEQDIPCLFVRGAVLVKDYEIEDDRIVMTASAWNGVYEQAETCFKDVEICGWFLCSGDSGLTDLYNLQKSHNENFKSQNQVLFLYDGSREEESVYRFDFHGAHRLKGYYIYYERNEQMQEYMISLEPSRKTEFALTPASRGVSDQAARQFRTIMETKQGKEGQAVKMTADSQEKENAGQNKNKKQAPGTGVSRFLRTVSVAALLCGAGFGMAAWYKYDKMQGVKDVLAVFAGKDSIVEETTSAAGSTEGKEESGQAVVSEVPGNVYPSEATSGSETVTGSSTAGADGQTSQTPAESGSAETTAEETTAAKTTAAESEGQAAEAPVYREYVVQSGDTLNKICVEIYGDTSASLVSEICSLNGMDNADFIFEGQTLKLPEKE